MRCTKLHHLILFMFILLPHFCFAQTTFSDKIIIQEPETFGPTFVSSCDLNGDGDPDVLIASYKDNKISWYPNMDGQGKFGEQQIITTSAKEVPFADGADLDGDGDLDVVSAYSSIYDSRIVWYENTDGKGNFSSLKTITDSVDLPRSVYICDLDGDGDLDVLSASSDDDKIAWYENSDGIGTFGVQQVLTDSADSACSVYASDLDGDGDMDVLSASKLDAKIAWYENTDGQGTFGVQKIITSSENGARCVYAADLDNDGDMDVLSASFFRNTIDWFENTDGQGTFGDIQMIGMGDGASSVHASDMDGDGDVDVDVVYACMADDRIAWNRNLYMETAVDEEQIVIPNDFNISQNYPNPFNNETVIQFDIIEKGDVNLTIYNMLGKPVVTIAEDYYQPGSYKVRFNGAGLPSGIYFYRLQAEGFTSVRKMVLME
ncbi:T9SS type A sorting domain-containing protein [bacterium]